MGVKDQFIVSGGARLQGTVKVDGAKNSVLKLMAAALLAEGTTTLTNCPKILDVPLMRKVLEGLGCSVEIDGHTVQITTPATLHSNADFDAVRQFRASVCVLGPLTARCGHAKVALPGGDAIGSRPLDMHQSGLEKMGASTRIEHGAVVAEADQLHGANIKLDFPSVGATENILTAAVLADGETQLHNAAREPEIVDLCTMLKEMGADISGEGTSTITIRGVDKLQPTEHEVIGDRIVAGTWAYAAVMTRGDITVGGIAPKHLHLPLEKLKSAGADIEDYVNGFRVRMGRRPTAVDYQTLPYPGFPTDMQPQIAVCMALAEGTSLVTEGIYDNRFRYTGELNRMGAAIQVESKTAVIDGVAKLHGCEVRACDLRAGAAMVIAALAADGTSTIEDAHYIERGYEDIIGKFAALGARIRRVETQEPVHESAAG